MTARRIAIALLWILSLVVAREWTTGAQISQPGTEVRFMQGQNIGGKPTGVLVANINGQWLPVTLEQKLPDGNDLFGNR